MCIIIGRIRKVWAGKLVSHRKKRGLIDGEGYNVCLRTRLGVGSQSECGIRVADASARRIRQEDGPRSKNPIV